MLYLFGFTQSGRKTADALLLDVLAMVDQLKQYLSSRLHGFRYGWPCRVW